MKIKMKNKTKIENKTEIEKELSPPFVDFNNRVNKRTQQGVLLD